MRWRAPWGCGPWGVFWRVGLPLARPAIAAGVALALMETVADYGTVHHFGVQTLTTGVFSTWLNGGNAGGAAQIAGVILLLILLLVALERLVARGARFHGPARAQADRAAPPQGLAGRWLAACAGAGRGGFLLPVGVMLVHSLDAPAQWLAPGLVAALVNTLVVGGLAALATVAAALFLVYALRMAGRGGAGGAAADADRLCGAGRGAGAGAVVPAGRAGSLAGRWRCWRLTGHDPGLMITGTALALGLAYLVRFFGIAQGRAGQPLSAGSRPRCRWRRGRWGAAPAGR
jgi:iron(III) transport system permease protein